MTDVIIGDQRYKFRASKTQDGMIWGKQEREGFIHTESEKWPVLVTHHYAQGHQDVDEVSVEIDIEDECRLSLHHLQPGESRNLEIRDGRTITVKHER